MNEPAKNLSGTTDYNELAPYWKDYVNFPGREDSYRFYVDLFNGLKAKKVLDVGGGVGHHAIELARAGIEAAMCDSSVAMTAEARKNAAEAGVSIDVKVADWARLSDFYRPNSFDGAMQSLTSVALNHTNESLAKNFNSVFYVLRAGGVFALDIRNFSGYGLGKLEEKIAVIDNEVFLVEAEVLIGFLTLHKPTNTKIMQYLKPWTPRQLGNTLMETGFRDVKMYFDFDRSQERTPYDEVGNKVRHIQVVAAKPT